MSNESLPLAYRSIKRNKRSILLHVIRSTTFSVDSVFRYVFDKIRFLIFDAQGNLEH